MCNETIIGIHKGMHRTIDTTNNSVTETLWILLNYTVMYRILRCRIEAARTIIKNAILQYYNKTNYSTVQKYTDKHRVLHRYTKAMSYTTGKGWVNG